LYFFTPPTDSTSSGISLSFLLSEQEAKIRKIKQKDLYFIAYQNTFKWRHPLKIPNRQIIAYFIGSPTRISFKKWGTLQLRMDKYSKSRIRHSTKFKLSSKFY